EGKGKRDSDTVLPVLTPAALALPTAVRLAYPCAELASLEVGDRVEVGDGRLRASWLNIAVVRTFRPSRVRLRTPALTAFCAPTDGSDHGSGAMARTQPSLGCGREDETVPRRLLERIGLGPGLTPEVDDELAGRLLVGAALRRRQPDLEPWLPRTTALSASLLRAAAQGYAVPAVVAYVDAVLDEDNRFDEDHRSSTTRLRAEVAAIGHTSGAALLRGIDAALDQLMPSNERTVA